MTKLITHKTAIRILEYHGMSATMDTEANKGKLVMDTNFYTVFGKNSTYKYNDLMEWLGY